MDRCQCPLVGVNIVLTPWFWHPEVGPWRRAVKISSFLVALGCVMKGCFSFYRAASLDFAVRDDDDNEKITRVVVVVVM